MMRPLAIASILLVLFGAAWPSLAGRVSDVRATPHNLSASGGSGVGGVKAVSESQVCAFCHTPHAATTGAVPLWNRKLSGATYSVYTSNSLDANAIQGSLDQPGGSSKLCLSCHDGTLAIGSVNVLNGQGAVTIQMSGTGTGGVMPSGQGASTGFTRNLGTDLTNDHPISVTYSSALATRDGELRNVDANQKWPAGSGSVIGVRAPGYRPLVPLEPTGSGGQGQVQCGSCHDPHIRETDTSQGNQKFLRHNRFQVGTPGTGYSEANDIICLSCHDKNQTGGTWAFSVHANPQVATQTYLPAATSAQLRDFPANLPVWKAACLNCHDTHTVQGARRLTREGTDSLASPKSGGASAIEEVCYQCHTATPVITNPGTLVPNVKSEFARAIRMPITNAEQGVTAEAHDVGGNFVDAGFVDCTTASNRCGADFIEARSKLGAGNLANRHAECTDCHNPHRVVKFRSFIGNAGSLTGSPDAAGTHPHTDSVATSHTNIASGVLRGTTGVEPVYGSASFHSLPTSYGVKRGDPGTSTNTGVAATYVTREYQICLKCHSDFGYDDNNVLPTGNRPALGRTGGTPSVTNNLTQYTNQAKEFQAPIGHKGGGSTTDSGAATNFQTNNHRSWHPVMGDTGRTPAVRGGVSANNWQFPWRNGVGTQTMYCSDCHGAEVAANNSVIPDGGENGTPWGPHGSGNNFLLKGAWNSSTGSGQQATGLCFKCHSYTVYATRGETRTGFWLSNGNDGHSFHADKIGRLRCNWCHVAVPHGWKNKAFLVNLNDVGQEAGQAPGTQVRNNTTAAYNRQPYYLNAILKIRNFRPSGQWSDTDCGSAGAPGNGKSGKEWMRDSNENCQNPP
ncbi:MAG: hypothetical protein HY017_24745 [Betaproteobacteria bacterium]|nr:hypothetical protein [Betaproteobacteria bacterium]